MLERSVFLAMIFVISGCATTNFNSSKVVEDAGTSYKQDGKIVDRNDLIRSLKDSPGSRDAAEAADITSRWAMGTGIGGGVLLGLGLGLPGPQRATATTEAQSGISDSDRSALLISGGVLFVGSIVLSLVSSKHLSDGVKAHNSSLQPTQSKTSSIDMSPYVGLAGAGGVCGLRIGF